MLALPPVSFHGVSDGQTFVPDERGRWLGWCAKYKGRRLTITAEAERVRRTNAQNRRYWTLIVPTYQEWVGELNKLQAHEDLLSYFNQGDRLLPTGEVKTVTKRSKDLTKDEFSAFMTRCEVGLAQMGLEFPEVDFKDEEE